MVLDGYRLPSLLFFSSVFSPPCVSRETQDQKWNEAVKLCMTHFDSSARAREVQCKILTEMLFTKREEAKLKLEFTLHPRKSFWLIKYYFPFTCKNIYFCFLFSPQIVKSILAFLLCKNDVMARSTRYFSQISTIIWEIVIVYLYL